MKFFYKATFIILIICLITACSRKNNTFINRNYHAINTEYNILYNGELAYQDAKKQLAANYFDNFWEILTIERIDVQENLESIRPEKSGEFDRAEEKATKAIQKHSMYIAGKEHNPQIDEAYMLLGKARYYDGRFIPALDAFNFILDRYPESNSVNSARVWRAKTNIRLNNEELAVRNLKEMLSRKDLEHEDWVDGAVMLSQAYINLDSLPQALEYIKIASENVKNKELKGRYLFIKGQLYNKLELADSANLAFDEVIDLKRKTSRAYYINSFVEKSFNFDFEKGDSIAELELLNKLAKDRENRPFLDRIHYAIAEFYRKTDRMDNAIENYNLSIKNFKRDRVLQSKNYLTLAEINFDRAEYKTAGAYYDSTLTFMTEKTREWRHTKKKRENLDDVIHYEDIAITNDSILGIIAMNDAERLAYFTDYTNELREKARQDSISQIKSERGIANDEFYKKTSGTDNKGGSFYFYNSATVAHGQQQFRRVWGDRALEDFWRISEKTSGLKDLEEEDENDEEIIAISEDERFKPESYIALIPTDQVVIDSIHGERNFAYYQLGLIYKEKFKEYELAADRLEKVLNNDPEERLVVPSKYNLIRIYEILGNNDKVAFFTNDILTNHSETRYAEILRNPNSQLDTDESSPDFKYKELYREFEAQDYAGVIDQSEEYIQLYDGTDIVPKFEMLKALAIGKQNGFESYKEALNFVALTYPNSDEGKQAQAIIQDVFPKIESPNFEPGDQGNKWKLVYKFEKNQKENALKLKALLDKAIEELNHSDLFTSFDYYDPNTDFVIVHGLKSKLGSQGFGEMLKKEKDYKIKHPFFEISSPNYKILQIHKNIEQFLTLESAEKTDSEKLKP